jgi:hypothetical protein
LAVLFCAGFWPGSSYALDVEQVVWGFDGQVVLQRYNPLSVLLNNPAPEPFEGTLRLQKMLGAAHPIDAVIEESVFISPFSSRWVQFYPHILKDGEQWLLAWGRGPQNEFSLPLPRAGTLARILLDEPGGLARRGGGMKRLPDNLFPATVAGTDALDAIVLDHAPRWEEPRRVAFLEWLARGGKVHILENSPGRYPEFPAALAKLNLPLETQRVGSGVIHRHPRTVAQIDAEFLDYEILEKPRPVPVVEATQVDKDVDEAIAKRARPITPLPTPDLDRDWQGDEFLFTRLRQMVKVSHNWVLINAMSIVYMLMIFPGCYLLGRRRVDYRQTFGVLLGTIALFSIAFAFVGRRGYGESTTVHSAAIARPLPDGTYDVTEWAHVFVTIGADYRIAHPGPSQLYSACQEVERVNGSIRNGAAGQFLVDIPPFSSRTFSHRGKLTGPPLEVKVESWEAGDQLRKLVLTTGVGFPRDPLELQVLYGNQLYGMTATENRLELQKPRGALAAILPMSTWNSYEQFGGGGWGNAKLNSEPATAVECYRLLFGPLVARNLGLRTQWETMGFVLPPDRARLFVYAPLPDSFRIQDDRLNRQDGYVLYSLDLFAPESP